MTDWNFADAFEAIAAKVPEAPAQMCGERVITWGEWDRRANALAADLLQAGLGRQSKVAAYMYNGVEYLEVYLGVWKAGMVPVNTNYRYGPDELLYLFDNADVEAVVFHTSFGPLLDRIRGKLPQVRRWYAVDDGLPIPDWAVTYEERVAGGTDRIAGPWGRSGDDLLMIYTGGTTGMPKGVMWRQDDLFNVLGGGGNPIIGVPPATDYDDLASRLTGAGARMLPACPLMHGTGQFSAFITLNGGGCVVTMPDRTFDPARLWQTVQDKQINAVVIVGDAFAKPMLAALDADRGRWDLSSLLLISSSGVMWSHETKQGLLRHVPQVILFDSLGSSEAVGLGASLSASGKAADTAEFALGEHVRVFTEDGKPVAPGSDETGMVAIGGYIPIGYYKDEDKTAKTFRTFDGVRYSVPGDYATVNTDGTLHLMGRGSVCINTGGEKVFPEEVEEILKLHPDVQDAVCVGVPDERFGEVVTAVVEPAPGKVVDPAALIEHVRAHLARYKAPRHVVIVPSIGRSPAGKVDYKGLRQVAVDQLA